MYQKLIELIIPYHSHRPIILDVWPYQLFSLGIRKPSIFNYIFNYIFGWLHISHKVICVIENKKHDFFLSISIVISLRTNLKTYIWFQFINLPTSKIKHTKLFYCIVLKEIIPPLEDLQRWIIHRLLISKSVITQGTSGT